MIPMAKDGSWYNGYGPPERGAKFAELKRLLRTGEVPPASGPCMLCGDSELPVEYHSEDYAAPYKWTPPAMLCLCRHCHRDKLHKRFFKPDLWAAFVTHVRRGGYASDLKVRACQQEIAQYRAAHSAGRPIPVFRNLRPYRGHPGSEWFATLRMDPESLRDPAARPR
jgi:hypothetical protein